MRIIGPPSASYETVHNRLSGATLLFIEQMVPALWDAALRYGIDPVGVVAQSFKETGAGRFTGKVRPEFFNTCGLKIRHQNLFPGITDGDNPLAHSMFSSWDAGATAHVQHLRAYAGWPVEDLVVDPRYWFVIGKHRCENFEDLGGKWAPSASYGSEIVTIANRLRS